jgi:hypothetical protein
MKAGRKAFGEKPVRRLSGHGFSPQAKRANEERQNGFSTLGKIRVF